MGIVGLQLRSHSERRPPPRFIASRAAEVARASTKGPAVSGAPADALHKAPEEIEPKPLLLFLRGALRYEEAKPLGPVQIGDGYVNFIALMRQILIGTKDAVVVRAQ